MTVGEEEKKATMVTEKARKKGKLLQNRGTRKTKATNKGQIK